MPEIYLNLYQDFMFISGIPGAARPDEIPYPSDQASAAIEEVAEELNLNPNDVEEKLLNGKTVEF